MSCGRPRKTTHDQDVQLVESVRNARFIRTSSFAAELAVSSLTVRRRLNDVGIRHRIPAKKIVLTERHKMLRLQFAVRYLNYDFEHVAFMDEKVFVSSADGRVSLYRANNTRYEENNVLPNRRSGRISIGFWGWMNSGGPIELCEIAGRMGSDAYLDILKDVFLPSARIVYPDHHRITFIQDNSSVHNARRVQNWISEQDDLELIKIPPKSPDLNPIENLWGLMVQNWDSNETRTEENLKAHAHAIWNSYRNRDYCHNMVQSMRARLQAVIDANGSYTKY